MNETFQVGDIVQLIGLAETTLFRVVSINARPQGVLCRCVWHEHGSYYLGNYFRFLPNNLRRPSNGMLVLALESRDAAKRR